MRYILSILGIIGSFYMLVYRQKIGDMIGEAEWMRKVGGIYAIVIFLAFFLFFWCIAEITGTQSMFVKPFLYLLPGVGYQGAPSTDF